ncbi:hypothetical protein [Aureimonas sp. AU40]|uniref:hypothetical protein n=1 Tax=Aureimonas sp. AU40 TaxID=1637747 RepID=UPI000A5E7562|nr:hypothetical protein [Aureimonas sp. AU40]
MSADEEDITGPENEVEEEEEVETEESRSAGSRLSEETWAEIENAYELGTKKMPELSKEYGVSRQSISRRFKTRNISFGTRAHELRQAQANGVKAAAASKAGQAAIQAAESFADQRREWVEESRVDGYKSLHQVQLIAKKQVAEAIRNNRPMASIDDDLKAVARYQKILIDNVNTRLGILNADAIVDEASLPELLIRDITDEEIHAIQTNADQDDDDGEIIDEVIDASLRDA